jgi:hypothetical protein
MILLGKTQKKSKKIIEGSSAKTLNTKLNFKISFNF